ncbi:MAG: hypothetical protein WDM85_01680 [Caulobacteraceae bacterium]
MLARTPSSSATPSRSSRVGGDTLVGTLPQQVDEVDLTRLLAPGDGDPRLQAAHLKIGVGRLGGDAGADGDGLRRRGRGVSLGGLVGAPQAAEDVDLPRGADAQV